MLNLDFKKYGLTNPYTKTKYENFIGGKWVQPIDGQYFDNISPITGEVFCQIPRSNHKDIELALDEAHKAKEDWAKTSVAKRAELLLDIANVIEKNIDLLATAEVIDNGKPMREAKTGDLVLAVDNLKYFAGCIRADEGGVSVIDQDTVVYHINEPLGVVGQIIPWNFPLLMVIWKIGPALATGNCVILKPAEQTPASVLILLELIEHLLPKGVLNVVNGFGPEAGQPLASSNRIAKIAFTGETETGKLILSYASKNIIPVTLELGGKSPNIFFEDILDSELADKAIEGLVMFALNQGQVCTAPSRALIHESIHEEFLKRAVKLSEKIKHGNPLDINTVIGAQVSQEQTDKILKYIEIGKQENAKCLLGGKPYTEFTCSLKGGFYIQPTIFLGHNKMRIFQEEIFGPVLAVTTFKNEKEAIEIANDTRYGLGAGVWTKDINRVHRVTSAIKSGTVWTNCYHEYPAHAAFGGYKQSGFGREKHKKVLDSYQQVKSVVISYSHNSKNLY